MEEKLDAKQFINDPAQGRAFIRKGLEQDLKCAVFTLTEVLKSPEVMDAYVETLWTRYIAFYEKQKAQVELEFPSNGKEHGE